MNKFSHKEPVIFTNQKPTATTTKIDLDDLIT